MRSRLVFHQSNGHGPFPVISRYGVFDSGRCTVGLNIDRLLQRIADQVPIDVIYRQGGHGAGVSGKRIVDHMDRFLVDVIHDVDRLIALPGAVGCPIGIQVIVKLVPEHDRPGVVQHPIDKTAGVFIAAQIQGLKLCPLKLVLEHLCPGDKLIQRGRRPVRTVDKQGVLAQIVEATPAGVVIPHVIIFRRIIRPQVRFRQHPPHGFLHGNASATPAFRDEPVHAPGFSVVPSGRLAVVGGIHVHSSRDPGQGGHLGRSVVAIHAYVKPPQVGLNLEILLFHILAVKSLSGNTWRLVAAIEPQEHGGILPHISQLRIQRLESHKALSL